MTALERVRTWPQLQPGADVRAYLGELHRALTEESAERLCDINSMMLDYEPIVSGTAAQYWRGDKSWQTLNQAAVDGLTAADSPTLAGLTLSGLTASLPVVTDGAKGIASMAYATLKANLSLAQADISGLTAADGPSFDHLHLTVADGTIPINVTSKTLCTNLNADLWDGYQFSDYLDQGVKKTSSPTFASGAFKKSAAHNSCNLDSYSDTAAHYAYLSCQKSHNNTIDTLTETTNGEILGGYFFKGVNNAGVFAGGAYLLAVQNGVAGACIPADLRFYVADDTTSRVACSFTKSGGVHVGGASDVADNNLYIDGDCSALTFTDRTPMPKDKDEAWAAIKSVKRQAAKAGLNVADHAALHPFLRSEWEIGDEKDEGGKIIVPAHTEVGRNISATLSALVEAVKDLGERVAALEK